MVEHYSNTQAYRVIKDDDTYILKIDKAANRYIDTEITALRRLADLPKIPNLIDVYMDKSEQYNWLLRENVEGKLFAEYITHILKVHNNFIHCTGFPSFGSKGNSFDSTGDFLIRK